MSRFPHTLRFRQVHLDFHTSGEIPNVGAKFSKRRFQEALRIGHVDSITLFSKCHHGWSYHPTKVGKKHPHLKQNLLERQIDACKEIGVRCPIYLSAGWDELAAATHPDWIVVDSNGSTGNPVSPGWRHLRFNSAYLDYLCAQIEEVVNLWPDNDGIFLDIVKPHHDYSRDNLLAMRKAGLDPARAEDHEIQAQHTLLRYYRRTNASARSQRADTPVFHNGGHIPIGAHQFNFFNSHFELESLPTGGWGYDHFPLSARYAITQPREYLGMTAKFHGSWGEFGGFKRAAALRYECSAMLANGAKCSVGDQLHPSGEMNLDTYSLIGAAYSEVEAKESWVAKSQPAARVALVSVERPQSHARGHHTPTLPDEGAARMLLELHQPFLVLDEKAGWGGFDVVILPDGFQFSPATLSRAQRFLKGGGRIIAAGSALLTPAQDGFALNPGARFLGRSSFDTDYIVATDNLPHVPVRSPIVIDGGAYEFAPSSKSAILVERRVPYFNRRWDHFSSHQHAPDSDSPATPAAILGKNIVYFAHDLFTQYRECGQPLYRDIFAGALEKLFPRGLPIRTNLPTVARFNLLEQKEHRRYVAHLLYAPISLRAQKLIWGKRKPLELIEELIPLRDITITLTIPRRVRGVQLAPQGTPIPFQQDKGTITFNVAEFTGHQMVAISY